MKRKIITIDGPSGSGKGSVAALLAKRLGWRILDSGALYRLTALAARRRGVDFSDVAALREIAAHLDVDFVDGKILLQQEDVTDAIRSESAGNDASRVAAIASVRAALLGWQQQCATPAGLVADGRDMGTVVFADAPLKIFLTASAEERAQRRYKQLKEKGMSVNLLNLVDEIRERDDRDQNRSTAPLCAAEDAVVIDSSALTIDEVLELIVARASEIF